MDYIKMQVNLHTYLEVSYGKDSNIFGRWI